MKVGVGGWVLGVGRWVLGGGCWVLGVGCWVLGVGASTKGYSLEGWVEYGDDVVEKLLGDAAQVAS